MTRMLKITDRIDLNLGYSCNINCRFCYYQKSLKAPKNLTTEEAKKWIKFFRNKGKEKIDFTGGEPTIRKDIIELVRYAKDLDYKTICIITNGIKMSDKNFVYQLADSGLNDVLFSIHGHTAEIHESLTKFNGSFERLIQAIAIAKSISLSYRTNTVVNGVNYKYLKDIARLLSDLSANTINFILFNPIVEAQNSDADMNVSYKEAAPYLKAVIDECKDNFEKITIRYIPFCVMSGYEEYVTNMPQIQYDPDEWDYYLRTYFRNGPFLWFGSLCFGFIVHPSLSHLMKLDFYTMKREAVKWSLIYKNKKKSPVCKQCSYDKICDGLWKDYADKIGFGELTPINGKKLNDPTHFMKMDIHTVRF